MYNYGLHENRDLRFRVRPLRDVLGFVLILFISYTSILEELFFSRGGEGGHS